MPQEISIDGDPITRDDESEVIPYVYVDADGQVVGKAYIPPGHTPAVPDAVDPNRSFAVGGDTDLAANLPKSAANASADLPDAASATATERLEAVALDEPYRSRGADPDT